MMMTYGCDWTVSVDEEEMSSDRLLTIRAPQLEATLGLNWLPLRCANDNLPEWLDVAK